MKQTLVLLLITLSSAYGQAQQGDSVQRIVDKFDGKITIYNPALGFYTNTIQNTVDHYVRKVTFMKVIANKKATYYISISCFGDILRVRSGPVILLLDNKQKINRGYVNIETEVNDYTDWQGGDYEHSTTFQLSQAEMQTLLVRRITDIRLNGCDEEVDGEGQNDTRKMIQHIINSK